MPKSIAIVGAGCAGIGAARTLMRVIGADVTATLIEANDWIGGRARTWNTAELPVDLGPQFIQDPEINPWAYFMEDMPIYTPQDREPRRMTELYRIKVGDGWTTASGNDGIEAMNGQLSAQFEIACEHDNAPIMTGNAREFCRNQQDIRLSLGSSGYGAIAESAEPWQYVAKDQARQAPVESAGNIYVPGGLGKMISLFGQQLLRANEGRLRLLRRTTVVSIDDTGPQKVALTMADHDVQQFDYCIVTIPPAEILKLAFAPVLSEPRKGACGLLRLGSYKKVAFRPTTFPPGDAEKPARERDSIEVGYEYYIYDAENDGVWQYFRLPTEPGILICVTAGDFARELDGKQDGPVASIIRDLLSNAYPEGDFTPSDDGVVVTNWTNQPHIHGAYSYTRFDPDYDEDDPFPLSARQLIAEPHGRIHFAGEASWIHAYGTIHGAYFTGIRAANGVLKAIRDS